MKKKPTDPIIDDAPLACHDEGEAVKYLEARRWGDNPSCPHCASVAVYRMGDKATGQRNHRWLWRCKACKRQYSVRTNTVFQESLIPLSKWCRAFWEATSSKNGISAMELSRKCQISYKSALFMAHRLRKAMSDDLDHAPKLSGIVEADETWIGGKPRDGRRYARGQIGKSTVKQPVVALLQRFGTVRTFIVRQVNTESLASIVRQHVESSAHLMTDGERGYFRVGKEFSKHSVVRHHMREYALPGGITTNSIEGFFARVKRGIDGVHLSVSRKHLHRYLSHFAYLHNTRTMTDGQRLEHLVRKSSGKRLMHIEQTNPV